MHDCCQVKKVEDLGKKYPVKINVIKGKRVNRIVVECNMRDQGDVIADIYKMLKGVDDEFKEEEQAELICKQVGTTS